MDSFFPISMDASICSEQEYEQVGGDSASSAEIYALISSLSKLPIRQEIAVTGSMNQHGEVQPIGGVNEKIEGFFSVCMKRGLTGTQGVIIPIANQKELMLRKDVIEAVSQGMFHIYPVSTVMQGIEILTGVKAGEKNHYGFERFSVNYYILKELHRLAYNLDNLPITPEERGKSSSSPKRPKQAMEDSKKAEKK